MRARVRMSSLRPADGLRPSAAPRCPERPRRTGASAARAGSRALADRSRRVQSSRKRQAERYKASCVEPTFEQGEGTTGGVPAEIHRRYCASESRNTTASAFWNTMVLAGDDSSAVRIAAKAPAGSEPIWLDEAACESVRITYEVRSGEPVERVTSSCTGSATTRRAMPGFCSANQICG